MFFEKLTRVKNAFLLRRSSLALYPKHSNVEYLDEMLAAYIERGDEVLLVGKMAAELELGPPGKQYSRFTNGGIKNLKKALSSSSSVVVVSEEFEREKKMKYLIRKFAQSCENLIVFYADTGRLPQVGGENRLTRSKFLSQMNEKYQLIAEKQVNGLGLYSFSRKP
jgi:hypothetical protein